MRNQALNDDKMPDTATQATDATGRMRRRVGWFVMLGIGAVVLMLLAVSIRTDVFAGKFTVYVSPPSASSFFVGQEVRYQGFVIGRIGDISLSEKGGVRVSMRILDRYHGMLHQGSGVRLVKQGLLGPEMVEITAGDSDAAMVADGALLPFRKQTTLEDLLMDMKPAVATADQLLGELMRAAKWLNDPNGDIRLATANLSRATEGVDKGAIQHALGRVSAAAVQLEALSRQLAEHKAGEHLAVSLQQTAEILQNIRPLTTALSQQGAMEKGRLLAARIDTLTRTLGDMAADMQQMTPELPALAAESRRTMAEVRRLAGAVRHSWLGGGSQPVSSATETVAAPAWAAP